MNPTESNETDPLLVLPSKTAATVRRNKRKKQRRNRRLVTISFASLAVVFGCMVVIKKAARNSYGSAPTSVLGKAKAAKSQVIFDDETGEYTIDRSADRTITASTTFAELAEIMLLPWYEASIMAVLDDPAWDSDTGIVPENVRPIRRTLLMARDMIDVFSPVFPDTPDPSSKHKKRRHNKKGEKGREHSDWSLWKELRTQYRHGYQLTGELHDLKGLTYSSELFDERVNAVLTWKKGFLAFQKSHEIRRYLYKENIIKNNKVVSAGGIDPIGCYYHEASHLFWSDSDSDILPCGSDSGTGSLRRLASVQLEHSLGYLEIIKEYTTVMPREHEINFHNLRKQLRIFVDEYTLFGSVLVPDDDVADATDGDNEGSNNTATTVQDRIDFLDTTQEKLGAINDKWTAHDVYVQDGSHSTKQKKLALQTDEKWFEFLDWEAEHDLKGVMEDVLGRLNT